ncbi:unnamed protein product [Phaedon cochleariae]|uniref:Major facilitator superfamily (MFS) profile domain-containing protein n=1 Tax=Phaedon cochleariae TaxID=80249 RepID=A0A9P0GND3_PHACE|nr:unnamed protein product [Phaedon cochleariae]
MTWYKQITVEVPILLLFFSITFAGSIMANLLIYRTCYVVLGYNQAQCALLGNVDNNITEHLEKLVQPEANIIGTIKSTSESVFSIIITMSLGPWSDRFGRKPIMVLSLLGTLLGLILISIMSYIEYISPWYFLIAGIPSGLMGGFPTFLTVILSYLTDITTEENRGMRMAIFEAFLAIGVFVGNISGPYVFYATNYASVFLIAAGTVGLSLLYTMLYIPESVQNVETEGKLKGVFQCRDFTEMIRIPFKRRVKYKRAIILLITGLSMIYIFVMNGDGAVLILFLRGKLHWTLKQYTLYNSASNVAWILGTVIGTYFFEKLLKVTASVIILMGLLSVLNGALLLGWATTDYHVYAAAAVRCLGGVISPMMRSLLSSLVQPDEIGKIFSMIMICEFIISLGASPLYTVIYNSTINEDPGIFNFFTAGLYVVNIVIIMIVMSIEYLQPSIYNKVLDDEETEIQNEIDSTIN